MGESPESVTADRGLVVMSMNDTLRARSAAAFGEGYELESEIGRGGMGVVYRCRDVKLRRHVAIKVLPPDLAFREDVRTRFLREAETAAQLNHPNIVPIYSVDERDGMVWFVMGLVDGESLGAILAREPCPPLDRVKRLLRETADALAYAHARGIIHRDIKPDNILIERLSGRPIVTDFGIARAVETESRLTVTGTAVGTPAYMSPEQAMGEAELDGRSDLYSLAVVGYQMLAGELPFKAGNTPAMLMKHLNEPLRPLRSVRPGVPAEFAAVVERCLAKKRADRFADAAGFRDALDALPPMSDSEVHMSQAWKHPAAGKALEPPVPPVAPHRLPRLVQPDRIPDEAGPLRWDRTPVASRSNRHSGDADNPPIPSFMPESWRTARQEWQPGRVNPGQKAAGWDRARKILGFRRTLAGTAVIATSLAFVNAVFINLPGIPWSLFPISFMAFGVLRKAGSLWAEGVRFQDVFGARARAALAGGDMSPRSLHVESRPSSEQLALELVPESVLRGPHGDMVRRAAGDRATAKEALAKLSPADRELIPDVAPALDELAERVSRLAQALHGVEEAAAPGAMAQVEARIAEEEALGESPGRNKRLEMLRRQRDTLVDLDRRRDRLREQLESASLMLQSMRLDLLALGSAGVQSAVNETSGTTQEARALSRDLRNALEAARELRSESQ